MRRSTERVPSEGEVLFDVGVLGASAMRAELINLSQGGLCGRGTLPRAARVTAERPLRLALGLTDGTPPITAAARVAWVDPAAASPTFGLCFVDLSPADRERLRAAVHARADAPATQAVRVRLDNGPVLRADAETLADGSILLGADLPWLRIGAAATGDLDDASFSGKVGWIGLHVGDAGIARLRVRVDVERAPPPPRHDTTLPYFSTVASAPASPRPEPAVPVPAAPVATAPVRRATHAALVYTAPARPMHSPTALVRSVSREPSQQAIARVFSLVRRGTKRRTRLALVRVTVVLLALSALFLVARALRQAAPSTSLGASSTTR